MKYLNENNVPDIQDLERFRGVYPKRLLDAVERTQRFHDYRLYKVEFVKDEYFFERASSRLVLTLFAAVRDLHFYYELEFSSLRKVRFDTDYDNERFTDRDSPFDEIFSVEIGVTDRNTFVFEGVSGNGNGFYIEFEKCRVLCRRDIK